MNRVIGSEARQTVRRLAGAGIAVLVNVGLEVCVAVRVAVGVCGIVGVGVEDDVGGRVRVLVGVGVEVGVLWGVTEAVQVGVDNCRAVSFQSNGSANTTYAVMANRQEQISRKTAHPRINPGRRQSEEDGGGW